MMPAYVWWYGVACLAYGGGFGVIAYAFDVPIWAIVCLIGAKVIGDVAFTEGERRRRGDLTWTPYT